jgi:hypothetical protein
MVEGETMIVPGPKLIELTVKSNAGRSLYELAAAEWPSYVLTPLYLAIKEMEDEMIGEE